MAKKNPNIDIENLRSVFFLTGIVISLSITLLAFEWSSSPSDQTEYVVSSFEGTEDVVVPVTRQDFVPPPKSKQNDKVSEVINIVKNDVEVVETTKMNNEADENTLINNEDIELTEETNSENTSFLWVEDMPVYPGGQDALRRYVSNNLKYPVDAIKKKIQGKVYVNFTVTYTGRVEKVTIARGIHPLLDSEAVRIIRQMPVWYPGKQRGKPVNVLYTFPINFQIP